MDLTPQEELFIDALFDTELNPDNDPDIAKQVAGYPASMSAVRVLRTIKGRLQDDVQSYFLSRAPLAARKVTELMRQDNPAPGSEKILAAAVQVLDRAGVTKKDKQEIEVTLPIGVIPLPPIMSYDQIESNYKAEKCAEAEIGQGSTYSYAEAD